VPISVSVTTKNGLDLRNGEYIYLLVPQRFSRTAWTGTLCSPQIYTCSSINDHTIKVEASASYSAVGLSTSFSFTIVRDVFVSPTDFNYGNDYFYVQTFTSGGEMIDKTDPTAVPASMAIFARSCGGKCSTCPSSSPNHCLTCYSPGSGVLPDIDYGNFNILNSNN
jgi:hypothetical protein